MTPQERFWIKVKKTDGCWIWTGAVRTDGYGNLRVKGRLRKAHRVSWELANGPIPAGMFVCHKCDNHPCVRPDHLFLGTACDNSDDMVAKGRDKHVQGEKHGMSKLTTADVIAIRYAYVMFGCTQHELAAAMGVTQTAISLITTRKQWRHI